MQYKSDRLYGLRTLLVVGSLFFSLIAYANDTQAIIETIQQQWNRPDQPVEVFPIAVANPYALAGWQQADKGGHALLYRHHGTRHHGTRHHGTWQVLFCGGAALSSIKALQQSGLNAAQATHLMHAWRDASSGLTPEQQQSLNKFEGIVPMHTSPVHASPAHTPH